jgi:CheY-like chemotaxis protein
MALRVLLADESVTIKKVIQLALQDFAVEVKAVPVGLDVLEVSKSFQPDLVFADILLQKRSGYEVCADLKRDAATAAIPVVLMWSSFMELDQRQVDTCGADGRLEKPFEVEALRKLVLELVPRTRSQRMAHFLEYPATLAAPLRQEIKPPPPPIKPPPSAKKTTTHDEVPTELLLNTKPRQPSRNSTSDPFASSLGLPPEASVPTATMTPGTMEFTRTPGIPDRPMAPEPRLPEAPLGALPDLQLEGQTGSGANAASPRGSGGWNMESFEPLDLAPLSLTDDDDENESFKPLQLPQAEPSTPPGLSFPMNTTSDLSLTDDDDDAEADQWSNRSLDKYRMAPLKPDESLALDESLAHDMSKSNFAPHHELSPELTTDKTELIVPTAARKRPAPPPSPSEEALPEFSMSDEDYNHTSRLEIEKVDHKDKTRPAIVHELLRDPDFSVGPNDRTMAVNEGAYDLSSEGKPARESIDSHRMEELIRHQLTPQLEKVIERVIEKTVAQLLPQIAERIIKKELERLLEET